MKSEKTVAMRQDWPRQPTFDLSVAIRRPPAAVYSLLADIQDAPRDPRFADVRLVKEPTGPTAVGTRWHERVKVAPGYWMTVQSVVTDVHEPFQLGMDFRSRWFTGHLTYEVEPVADGSILRQRETLRLRAPLRGTSRFIERRMRPSLQERLTVIKEILEATLQLPLPGRCRTQILGS